MTSSLCMETSSLASTSHRHRFRTHHQCSWTHRTQLHLWQPLTQQQAPAAPYDKASNMGLMAAVAALAVIVLTALAAVWWLYSKQREDGNRRDARFDKHYRASLLPSAAPLSRSYSQASCDDGTGGGGHEQARAAAVAEAHKPCATARPSASKAQLFSSGGGHGKWAGCWMLQ